MASDSDSDATGTHAEGDADYDVVIVGGGPSGCSAALFTARYGLDTAVFDGGNSSLRRCAFLENYLGFPAGIDVDSFYDLLHEHVTEVGAELVTETVEGVTRRERDSGFVVETDAGRTATASRVVAATREGGEYLRSLGEEAMFVTDGEAGESRERFDPDYPDSDGRTPVEGLYVAAPAGDSNAQVVISAGHGARVARTLLEDHRREKGYPATLAPRWDWRRRDAELTGEWADPDRWREWFDARVPDDHDLDGDRLTELREADVERRFDAYLSPAEVSARADRGLERLVETLGPERVLDALDDERIEAYLADEEPAAES